MATLNGTTPITSGSCQLKVGDLVYVSWPFHDNCCGIYLGDDPDCAGRAMVFIDGAPRSLFNEQILGVA
jgi:hypothetical protein|tara:strand:- start:1108 stop:1314 length:207 start_codon:yes stop_codon:yes gene_type:complete